jgi:hypothetical protein
MKLIDGQEYTPNPKYTTIFKRCQLCGTVIPYTVSHGDESRAIRETVNLYDDFQVSTLARCETCDCQTVQLGVGYKLRAFSSAAQKT